MWYVYTMEFVVVFKKMDAARGNYELSQSQKEISCFFQYMVPRFYT